MLDEVEIRSTPTSSGNSQSNISLAWQIFWSIYAPDISSVRDRFSGYHTYGKGNENFGDERGKDGVIYGPLELDEFLAAAPAGGGGKLPFWKHKQNRLSYFLTGIGDGTQALSLASDLMELSELSRPEADVTLTVNHGNYKATSTISVTESEALRDSTELDKKGIESVIHRPEDEN